MRTDYYIRDDWDIEFTEWGDIRTVDDERVLIQNFVLLAHDIVGPYRGQNPSAADEQRLRNQLEARFGQRSSVDSVVVRELTIDEDAISLTVVINSTEFSRNLRIT